MAKETCNWKLEAPQGDLPLPRSNHTAVDIGENQMLVFGGLFSSNQRFNDTYILKIGKSNSFFIIWGQVNLNAQFLAKFSMPQQLENPKNIPANKLLDIEFISPKENL
jgi:hypothetical protein